MKEMEIEFAYHIIMETIIPKIDTSYFKYNTHNNFRIIVNYDELYIYSSSIAFSLVQTIIISHLVFYNKFLTSQLPIYNPFFTCSQLEQSFKNIKIMPV